MTTATLSRPTPPAPPTTTLTAVGAPAAPAPVVVDRTQLAWSLAECARLGRSTSARLPWTGRVFLFARGDRTLKVTRSNGDTEITATIPTASTSGTPGVAVPALAALRGLVGLLDSDDVALTFTDDTLAVTAGAAAYRLASLDPDSHPAASPRRGQLAATPLTPAAVTAIRRVLPFASTDDARPVLTGVVIADGKAVTTDSYRLAIADVDTTLPPLLAAADPLRRLLRTDTAWTAARHLPTADDAGGLELTSERTTWRTRLLDGRFPDWNYLIPPTAERLTFDRPAALRALARLTTLARHTPITLTAEADRLAITADTTDGAGTETLPCSGSLAAGPLSFNARYLIDALRSLTQPTATLDTPAQPTKPITFREPCYLHLLMPVTLPHSEGQR